MVPIVYAAWAPEKIGEEQTCLYAAGNRTVIFRSSSPWRSRYTGWTFRLLRPKIEGLELSADGASRVNLKHTTGLGTKVAYPTSKPNCGCLSFLLFFIRIVVTDLFSESHCLQWLELQYTNLTFSSITGIELPYASMKYFIFYWCRHKPKTCWKVAISLWLLVTSTKGTFLEPIHLQVSLS